MPAGPGPAAEFRAGCRPLFAYLSRVPATGGYRAILTRRPLQRLLDQLEPDRLEVSDRTTLRWTGAWAQARGVRSVMVSHDSLAGLMALFSPPGVPAARLADHFNRRTAASYDVVVCTTAWAAAEFRRLGVPNLLQVPLGVDLSCFCPERRDEGLRARLAPGGQALLVHCSRLSPEKRPQRAIGALAELRRRGLPAVLVVAGDGPQRRALQSQARGLPVRFLRHISDRGRDPGGPGRLKGRSAGRHRQLSEAKVLVACSLPL